MRRPLLIILSVLGAILLVVAGIYLRAKLNKPATVTATPVTSGGLPTGGSFPVTTTNSGTAASSSVSTLTENQTISYAPRADGTVVYLKFDGQIVSVSSVSSTIVSTRKFTDLLDGSFSYNGNKVLIKSGNGSSPRWSVYDLQKNAWRELSIETRDARWAPQDNRIAYWNRKLSNQSLTVLDLSSDNSKPRTLLTLNAEDMDLTWAGASHILFGERASASASTALWNFDLGKAAMTRWIESGNGITVLWGKSDQGLLFTSHANGNGGSLTLIGKDGSSAQTFSFLTLPSKCAFFTNPVSSSTPAGENMICAIPRDTRAMSQASLPDDYQRRALVTQDDIYQIILGTGSFTPILNDPNRKIDASQLKVFNNKVYFIDQIDHRLYSLNLR